MCTIGVPHLSTINRKGKKKKKRIRRPLTGKGVWIVKLVSNYREE